jgi:hypothetical protein
MFVRLLISVKDKEVDGGQDEWWIKCFSKFQGSFYVKIIVVRSPDGREAMSVKQISGQWKWQIVEV